MVDPAWIVDIDELDDPHEFYHQLRREEPVHWNLLTDSLYLTRHDDVAACLGDDRFSVARVGVKLEQFNPALASVGLLDETFSKWLIYLDPPHHARLRSLIMRAFTPAVLRRQEARIETVVEELVEAALQRHGTSGKPIEVMSEIALPLTASTLGDILGLRMQLPVLVRWTSALAAFIGNYPLPDDELAAVSASIVEIDANVREILAEKRENPGDDLLSALIGKREQASDAEIVSLASLLLAAGQETTTGVIGYGILRLLRDSDLAEELRKNPEKIDAAVEEFLRLDSPVQITQRVPREDIDIRGQLATAGVPVNLMVGAANRDPEVFPDPDRVDLTRNPNRHLAFSSGIHFCVGAYLARLQARKSISSVLRRLPTLRLVGHDRLANVSFRNLRSLRVSSR